MPKVWVAPSVKVIPPLGRTHHWSRQRHPVSVLIDNFLSEEEVRFGLWRVLTVAEQHLNTNV